MANDLREQEQILTYWVGENQNDPASAKLKQKLWYSGGAVDEEIREKFVEIFDRACAEMILHWGESAPGSLALVILLDQFSRNLHRGTVCAYAQDPLARAVAKRAFKLGFDRELSVPGRIFLLHPFHHSENMTDQAYVCMRLYELVAEGHDEWEELLNSSITWFERHRDTIRRFSRFPHRNLILGRKLTDEEEIYLAESESFISRVE